MTVLLILSFFNLNAMGGRYGGRKYRGNIHLFAYLQHVNAINRHINQYTHIKYESRLLLRKQLNTAI